MQLHLDSPTYSFVVRAYAIGQVTVNDEVFTRSLIVTPDRLYRDWPPRNLDELAPEHLQVVLGYQPEIILLGTGERLRFPEPRVTAEMAERSIGLEVMDTGAACRTYNILMAEGRNVAAALLIGPSE